MLLSRSEETSESVPTHLILLLFSLAVLSLFSTYDARAESPLKFSAESVFNNVSFEKSLEKAIPLRSRAITGSADSPTSKTCGILTRPISPGATFGTIGTSSLSSSSDKPLPPLSNQTSAISIRRIRQTSLARPAKLPQFKPSLAGGAIYRFGSEDSDSRLTMDFLLPAPLARSSSLFFESRAEYQDPFAHFLNSMDARFDLGLGVGCRHAWDNGVMLGTNFFWDASRMNGDWYTSPGFGLEFAVYTSSVAWDVILNAYRGGGVDLKSGFTFPILEDRLDLRLYAEKCRFFDGEFILGSKFGAEISVPARLFTVSYEYGQDSQNPGYHAIGCSLAVPFRLENIFRGKNPFERPDWPDRELRYTERLQSEGVRRAWRRPDTVVEARNTPQGKRWTTPGMLTGFPLTKTSEPAAQTTQAAKDDSKTTCQSYDWKQHETKKPESLIDTGKALLLLGLATYITGDYTYRNAFGPFDIEPYEKERIRQEMPKKERRK